LRDFSIGIKKYKNGKLLSVTFLYFLMPIEKDPKDRLLLVLQLPHLKKEKK
jgi:hypothetical protein